MLFILFFWIILTFDFKKHFSQFIYRRNIQKQNFNNIWWNSWWKQICSIERFNDRFFDNWFDIYAQELKSSIVFDWLNLLLNALKKIRESVLKDLKSNIKIFIACDIWTNSNKLIFLKMIVYFIDKNWRYRKILFAFQFLQKRHDENKLANVILKIFMKYKLENRLIIVTADNVFNNRILRRCLRQKLQNHEIEWNHKQKNCNCMTHALQLTVTIILTDLNIQIRNDNIAFKFDVENFQQISHFFLKNTVRKINV